MSGGHFDYKQHGILEIADELERVLHKNDYYQFNPATILEMEKGLAILKQAYIYANRIDWLLSADDGEESFIKHLKEQLK